MVDYMKWKITYYADVEQEISEWPASISAKFLKIIELLEQFGPIETGMPHIKPMGKGIFEIRAKGKDGIGRALFCSVVGKNIIVLKAFIKKTEKTPKKELDLAKKRMLEVTKK
jgi:phage-related protein